MKRSDANDYPGFTSVEALAATALASTLMVAVLGILAGIAKKEKLLNRQISRPAWHEHLSRQLEADLRHARSVRREQGRLILMGHGGTAGAGLTRNWLPSEVHYYVAKLEDQTLLLRQEVPVAGGLKNAEVLAIGASRLELLSDVALNGSNVAGAGSGLPAVPDGPLPSRLWVVVLGDSASPDSELVYSDRMLLY